MSAQALLSRDGSYYSTAAGFAPVETKGTRRSPLLVTFVVGTLVTVVACLSLLVFVTPETVHAATHFIVTHRPMMAHGPMLAHGVRPQGPMAGHQPFSSQRSSLVPLKTAVVTAEELHIPSKKPVNVEVTPDNDIVSSGPVAFPPPLSVFQRLQRSAYFYSKAIPIIWSYQVLQWKLKTSPPATEQLVQEKWDNTHEKGSKTIADVIDELKGFYVKSGQLIATRVDLFPEQYTSKLSKLQDDAEPMSFELVRAVVEQELLGGGSLWEVFESFDSEPLGSASVAQVHKATLIGGQVVAVKVQRPNIEPKMMGDIGNLKTISKQLRDQLPYDYYVIFSELETQLINEFDFLHEARSMTQVADHLSHDAVTGALIKPFVRVPRPITGLVSKRAMVMDYVEGQTLTQIADQAKEEGGKEITPVEQELFARMLLKALTAAFGRMIFETGFFHGDPHPGNIMFQSNGEVALIDWGQTKQISRRLKLNLARVITALSNRPEVLTDKDYALFAKLVTEIGVKMTPDATNVTCAALAIWLFDSTPVLPGGYSTNELSENAPVRKVASFPQELVFVGRSTVLIRGIAAALGVEWSLAQEWGPSAAQVLQPRSGVVLKAQETAVRFRYVLATFGVAFSTLGMYLLRKVFSPLPETIKAPCIRFGLRTYLFGLSVIRNVKNTLRLGSTKRVATGAQLA